MRVGRIELPSRPWQGRILPLNHTRSYHLLKRIDSAFKRQRAYYSVHVGKFHVHLIVTDLEPRILFFLHYYISTSYDLSLIINILTI